MLNMLTRWISLFLILQQIALVDASFPFFSERKKYTPLLFFKVPNGLMKECDAMEKVICEVEKELGVSVERMDVLKDPASEALLNVLSQQRTPPFLYHRESCQTVFIRPSASDARKDSNRIHVDKARIRAWAKGRHLSKQTDTMHDATKVSAPMIQQGDDNSMDQSELLDEMSLTDEQLKGKRAMEERTAAIKK